jgi:hypothetical protein
MWCFVNLKIKLSQSYKAVHKNSVCVYVFIGVSDREYLRLYYIFLKNYGDKLTA